jgi:hypothetical protein
MTVVQHKSSFRGKWFQHFELHSERIPRSLSERSIDPDPSGLWRSENPV